MKLKQHRILYVQKHPGGGSMTGLLDVVRGLDKTRFFPVVLLYSPHYKEDFEALGAKVVVVPQPPAKSSTTQAASVPASRQPESIRPDSGRPFPEVRRLIRRDWPLARQVARILREEKIDLIHHNSFIMANRDAIIGARLAGVPQVCHVRWLNDYSRGTFTYYLDRFLSRSIKQFIYMTKAVERVYRELGVPKYKGVVIDDPFESTDYDLSVDTAAVRAEHGLSPDDLVLSNIGRLVEWKGQHYFVEAMAQVVRSEPRAKALLIGGIDPTPESREYSQRLHQLVADLGLSDHVFFTGLRSDIPRLLAASDVMVHSSCDPEPFGRVVVEGMAAGKPVIATDGGGVPEIIENGVTGLLVPLRDADEMAKAILHLLQNRETAAEMGRQAQRHVRDRFSLEKHMSQVHRIYERILAR